MSRGTIPGSTHLSRVPIAVLSAALVGLSLVGLPGFSPAAQADERGAADLSRVFRSWDEWADAYDDLVAALDAFDALADQPVTSADTLLAVMEARDQVYRSARGVEDYIYLRLQLNGGDEEARSREHLLDATDTRWYATSAPWFDNTLDDLGRTKIDGWMAEDEALQLYTFFFRRFFDSADHRFPEEQEELQALSRIARKQSSRIYTAISRAEAPIAEAVLDSGASVTIDPARAHTMLWETPSPTDRRRMSRARLEALGRQSQTYAALLEGIAKRQKLLADVRGFDSALTARLHSDAIPADTVRNVIRVARETPEPMRRYHSLRRQALELEDYGLADRFFPLDPNHRKINLEEAREVIIDSSTVLGPEVRALVEKAFSEGWIDSIASPGKRIHGGATFVAGHAFVLVNYHGSLDHLFQLSHEIGHAVHSTIAYRAQPLVYTHPSSLTGETVAAVFEGALVAELVDRATTREERVRVLDLTIQNLLRLFYRPMLDADFELRIYDSDGSITGPAVQSLYLEVVRDFYGDSVRVEDWDAHAWQQTPHYYTAPLYLGRYGLSTAAANSLMVRLMSPSGPAAESAWKRRRSE